VQGEWRDDGIWVKSKSNQFLRTLTQFDLGADYTLEISTRVMASDYMTIGFRTGTRFKLRTQGAVWWVRVSASDADGQQNISPGKTMPPLDTPVTYTVSRHYDATTNYTMYTIYANGSYVGRGGYSGVHRSGDSSDILIGNENDDLIVHCIRLYNRALTADEIALNYEHDTLRFFVNNQEEVDV
jgi:hypothetical protein